MRRRDRSARTTYRGRGASLRPDAPFDERPRNSASTGGSPRDGPRHARPRDGDVRLRSSAWSRRATGSDPDPGGAAVLYLTAVLTVAALIYLGYAMIRPERF